MLINNCFFLVFFYLCYIFGNLRNSLVVINCLGVFCLLEYKFYYFVIFLIWMWVFRRKLNIFVEYRFYYILLFYVRFSLYVRVICLVLLGIYYYIFENISGSFFKVSYLVFLWVLEGEFLKLLVSLFYYGYCFIVLF